VVTITEPLHVLIAGGGLKGREQRDDAPVD